MRIKTILSTLLLCTVSISAVSAQELTGDVRLACEAILCLSSSTKPGECSPSLRKYFGISHKMPNYCSAYLNHEYTNLNESLPVYVGTPTEGGFWTEKSNYETTLKQYNERKANNNKRYWMD